MSRRYVAFLVALAGAGAQLFGSIVGQGMMGQGMLFGAAGPDTSGAGALVGLVAAVASLFAAVLLMLVRDVRAPVAVLLVAGALGTLAAGFVFGVGALIALVGARLARGVDRSAPVA